jgi:amidohydrolase
MLRHCFAAVLTVGLLASPARASDSSTAHEVDAILAKDYPRLRKIYEDLHQHPELGFAETRTAALLAKEMRALGFTVTEKVGRTGLVAIYRNGEGPTVMVRTELDALPMEEKTGLPYASRVQAQWEGRSSYVAHACGHDSHMTMWVGAARVLLEMKDRWRGTLMFIGQPAEESLGGAKAMLADGLFERFPKPDVGFAAHVNNRPAGTVSIKRGLLTSASDSVEITFKGRGGHGSRPSATIDPIVIAARFITDVQTIISREKDAAQFGVITVGSIQAGTVGNIIPDEARLKLTLRSYSSEVRSLLLDGVRRVAVASAQMANAPAPEIEVRGGTNSVINDAEITEQTSRVLQAAFGDRVTVLPETAEPVSASEDYSEFIAAGVPSVFFNIGSGDPALHAAGKEPPVNHSPMFAPVPEPTIKTGAAVLALAVMTTASADPPAAGN